MSTEEEIAVEIDTDEVEESFSPVGVRVRPEKMANLKPADTYIAGYNVDEAGVGGDDDYSTTLNDIETTGVDPYNSGGTN